MTNQSDTAVRTAPFTHAFVGTVLLVFAAPGLYLLIAGAVAPGIAMARR